MQSEIRELSLAVIDEPPIPMRAGLEPAALQELADSIRAEGLINPITVRPKGDRFEVVAGHRRFRACGIAGVFVIKCVVAEISDEQAFNIMAAENLNRQDVDPVEEALFLGRLIGEDETKIPGIAKRMGRSNAWVEERLELLQFSEIILAALRQGQIKLGVGQWLGRVDNEFWQQKFLDQAINHGMSVFQARILHDQYQQGMYKSPEDFMPSDIEGVSEPRRKVSVKCEKCGELAVEPNFQSVFIHMECPKETNAA